MAYLIVSVVFLAVFLIGPRPSKHRGAVAFGIVYLLGVALASAMHGPLRSLFGNVLFPSSLGPLFREVYHFSFLTVLGLSLLLAQAVGRLRERGQWWRTIAHGLVILVVISSFSIITVGSQLNIVSDIESQRWFDNDATLAVSSEPSLGRVLWQPAVQPIQYPGLKYAGIDPAISFTPRATLGQSIQGGGTAFGRSMAWQLTVALIGDTAVQRSGAANLLRVLNIRDVVVRSDGTRSLYPDFAEPEDSVDPNLWTTEGSREFFSGQDCFDPVSYIGAIRFRLQDA
jgi:hypothetical protein